MRTSQRHCRDHLPGDGVPGRKRVSAFEESDEEGMTALSASSMDNAVSID
jgi:hypothetical protein